MPLVSRRKHGPRGGRGRRLTRPVSKLAERWTTVDEVNVFYRESRQPPDAAVMMHVHGFGLSGRYLLPTAERLADDFHTLVPDLPGFGRSGRSRRPPRCARSRPRSRQIPRRPPDRVGDPGRKLDGMPGHLRIRTPVPRAPRPGRARVTGRRSAQPTLTPRPPTDRPRRSPRAHPTSYLWQPRTTCDSEYPAPSRCSAPSPNTLHWSGCSI